jgi:hypothetical protein
MMYQKVAVKGLKEGIPCGQDIHQGTFVKHSPVLYLTVPNTALRHSFWFPGAHRSDVWDQGADKK